MAEAPRSSTGRRDAPSWEEQNGFEIHVQGENRAVVTVG